MANTKTQTEKKMKQYFQFLVPAISENIDRRSLMFIQIKQTENMTIFTAANGFLIKEITTYLIDLPLGEYYLDLQTATRINKIAKKSSSFLWSETGVLVDDLKFGWSDFDATYPDLSGLVRDKSYGYTETNRVGLDSKILIDALKGRSDNIFKMEFTGNDNHDGYANPIKISFADQDYLAFIMPIRVKW